MKKGERLDISVSVIATEDVADELASIAGREAMMAASEILTRLIPAKRFVSGIAICAKLKRVHRRVFTSRRRSHAEPETGSGTLQ